MEMLENLAVFFITLLLPFGLILLYRAFNRDRNVRYRQWPLFPMGLAAAFLCSVLHPQIAGLIDRFLDLQALNGIYQWISGSLPYGYELYSAYLLNAAVLIICLVIRILMNGMPRLFGGRRVHRAEQRTAGIANLFYEIIRGGDGRVRAVWFGAGKMCIFAGRLVLLGYLLLLIFAQIPLLADLPGFPYDTVDNWLRLFYIWPAVSAVLVLEFVYLLDGNDSFSGTEEAAGPGREVPGSSVDYSGLEDQFIRQFPERFAGAVKVPSDPDDAHVFQPKSELSRRLYKRLQEMVKETKRPIAESVLNCIADLPERENALIDAHLISDFGKALMLYFNILLARGENLLVICRDEETCSNISRFIEETLKKINRLGPVWIVRTFRRVDDNRGGFGVNANSDCDVLVVTPDAVIDDTVIHAQERFFRGLTTVLMVDVSGLISEMGTLMMAMANHISAEGGNRIQYIGLCNGIPAELRTTLEQVLSPGREFRPYDLYVSSGTSHVMLWNYEPAGKGRIIKAQENLFGKAMDQVYLGTAIPFACAGRNFGVENVSIISSGIPSVQLDDAIHKDFPQMRSYFEGIPTADALTSGICFQRVESNDPFIIVVDDTYNLPMAIRNYSRFIGSSSAMVHVISKSYMLRDYFAAHAKEYLMNRALMESFSSIFRDTEKTVALKLFFEAGSAEGLSRTQLMKQMSLLKFDGSLSLRKALEKCYEIVRNGETTNVIENYFAVSTRSSFDEEKNDFVYQQWITLKEPGISLLQKLIGDVQPARLEVENEQISLGITRGNIFQYYLPDQAVVVNKRMYYINKIDSYRGVLIAGRKIDKLDVPVDYFQHREYTLNTEHMRTERKVTPEISQGAADEIRAEKYEVELLRDVLISVETLGQIVPDPGAPMLDLTSKYYYRDLNPGVRAFARRVFSKGSVMAVRFLGVRPDEADRVSVTLAVLFSEVMKTLFPYNWQCVAVCPVLHGEIEERPGDIPFENLALAYPQVTMPKNFSLDPRTAEILIIEDSVHDIGILDSLFRNRQNPLNNVFSLIRDYLNWQRRFGAKRYINISTSYLSFGAENIPSYFNLDYVADMLRQLEVVHPSDGS